MTSQISLAEYVNNLGDPNHRAAQEYISLIQQIEQLSAENEALMLELGLLETENKLWRDSLCKLKADAIREYVSNSMEANWILHLNENNLFHMLLINLNDYANQLEKQAKE